MLLDTGGPKSAPFPNCPPWPSPFVVAPPPYTGYENRTPFDPNQSPCPPQSGPILNYHTWPPSSHPQNTTPPAHLACMALANDTRGVGVGL
eukprot:NODE_17572_length_368_cov_11.755102_g17255_i0.p1 GENE.NODE_17572_length_368_cov_11.755102_g17255_i0~~NODE_17572_length_368_cov_11.755102_g17255_i0.p1  ORF type:complete len:104 (+),score=2.67 NODE_17572_length_368_cov_11.755102_g17255_i0:42-314(+)